MKATDLQKWRNYILIFHHKGTDIFVSIDGMKSVAEPITTASECRKFPPFSNLPMEWMFGKSSKPSIDTVVARYK